MSVVSRGSRRGGSRHRGNGRADLTFEVQGEESIQFLRPCRAIIAVDVSGSMVHLIDGVINGISEIDSVLKDEDLVSCEFLALCTLHGSIGEDK